MIKKRQFLRAIALTGIILLSSCASMRYLKSAEEMWNRGNIADSLISATRALQEKNDNTKAMQFLAQRYDQGISLIEERILSLNSVAQPKRAVEKVKLYEKLVTLNRAMKTFIYPFTDKKATFSWTPEDIKDYTFRLKAAKAEAAESFLQLAVDAESWPEIDSNGKRALSYAAEPSKQDEIRDRVTNLLYDRAVADYRKGTEKDLLSALEGLKYCTEWKPGFKDSEQLKIEIRSAIAEIYYNKADALTAETASRSDLKKAINLFQKALTWTASYRDATERIAALKERLAIYLFSVFDQKSYKFPSGPVNVGYGYPADIRGVYLQSLNGALRADHNIRFVRRGQGESAESLLHPYIMELESQTYGVPQFITAAEEAGLTYLVVLRLRAGNEAGEITTGRTTEVRQRPITRKRAKVVYTDANGQSRTTYADPPQKVIDQLEAFKMLGLPTSQPIYNQLVKYGAVIPKGATFSYSIYAVNDTLEYEVVIESFYYPVTVTAEMVHIESREIVKKVKSDLKVSGKQAEYMTRTLKNHDYYDASLDIGKNRVVLNQPNDDVVTVQVLNKLFQQLNKQVAPVLNQLD